MYRIKGTDSFDKVSWLSAQGYWVEKKDSTVFTTYEAQKRIRELNVQNRYAESEDRMTVELEAQ